MVVVGVAKRGNSGTSPSLCGGTDWALLTCISSVVGSSRWDSTSESDDLRWFQIILRRFLQENINLWRSCRTRAVASELYLSCACSLCGVAAGSTEDFLISELHFWRNPKEDGRRGSGRVCFCHFSLGPHQSHHGWVWVYVCDVNRSCSKLPQLPCSFHGSPRSTLRSTSTSSCSLPGMPWPLTWRRRRPCCSSNLNRYHSKPFSRCPKLFGSRLYLANFCIRELFGRSFNLSLLSLLSCLLLGKTREEIGKPGQGLMDSFTDLQARETRKTTCQNETCRFLRSIVHSRSSLAFMSWHLWQVWSLLCEHKVFIIGMIQPFSDPPWWETSQSRKWG